MPTLTSPLQNNKPRIGIIGGGIAGSTIAIKLSALGLKVSLLEQGPSLVNGPPICHLHAGGNLYREIDDEQCLTLLRQSIATLKLYKDSADYRPTVIAIPKRDPGEIDQLLPRLEKLRQEYAALVDQDSSNQVLGKPMDYYTLYHRQDIERLAKLAPVNTPTHCDEWLIPVAKSLDLDKLKFPLVLVQEYGLSVFRLAASATLALDNCKSCNVHTDTQVIDISRSNNVWQVTAKQNGEPLDFSFDYLINACGYQSGSIDDLIGQHSQRLVEFKAAYVTHWHNDTQIWPEVIIYGERGTPNGMAQLTPYPGGYFQIHGMTQDITLFEQGLVKNCDDSAQPKLAPRFLNKLNRAWPQALIEQRTDSAIDFVSEFLPDFSSATLGGKPLFGAQQIPGQDPDLRAADICFSQANYARCEIVKASSAIDAAHAIVNQLIRINLLDASAIKNVNSKQLGLNEQAIETLAIKLAQQRNYPIQLATRLTRDN